MLVQPENILPKVVHEDVSRSVRFTVCKLVQSLNMQSIFVHEDVSPPLILTVSNALQPSNIYDISSQFGALRAPISIEVSDMHFSIIHLMELHCDMSASPQFTVVSAAHLLNILSKAVHAEKSMLLKSTVSKSVQPLNIRYALVIDVTRCGLNRTSVRDVQYSNMPFAETD